MNVTTHARSRRESSSFFDDTARWRVERGGFAGTLPLFYYDATIVSAMFTADVAGVRALLPDPRVHAVEAVPGRAVVLVSACEYRRADLAPYNEVVIAFAATFGRRPLPGVTMMRMAAAASYTGYVWQLPVTTEEARLGGVGLYGLPKFLADITFARELGTVACELRHGGQRILSLEGHHVELAPPRESRLAGISFIDGAPVSADARIRHVAAGVSRSRRDVRLDLGDHPIARALSSLDVSDRPLTYEYSPRAQMMLMPPRNLY